MEVFDGTGINLDLWKAQNIYFAAAREIFPVCSARAERGDPVSARWVKVYLSLGKHLGVRAG